MGDSLLDQLRRSILGDELAAVVDGKAPSMLDLRPRRGPWKSLPYQSLREVTYDPNKRPPLLIEFSSYLIEVEGSALEGVYLAIVGQRAVVLSEVQAMYRDLEDDVDIPAQIDRLTIKAKRERKAGRSGSS